MDSEQYYPGVRLFLYDRHSGEEIYTGIDKIDYHTLSMKWSPDGWRIIFKNIGEASDFPGSQISYHVPTGRVQAFFSDFKYRSEVQFTPDGKLIYMKGKTDESMPTYFYVAPADTEELTPVLRMPAALSATLVPKRTYGYHPLNTPE